MKLKRHLLFLSVIFFLSFQLSAQGIAKRKALAHRFLSYTYPHLVLDTILWEEQEKISSNIDNYFKEYGLKINNPDDYEYFLGNIDHQFKFLRKHILDQIRYQYEQMPYDSLKRLVKGVNNGLGDKIITTSLYPRIKKLAEKEIKDLHKYSIPKYLELIKKRHEPVDLKIFYNHYKAEAQGLPMEIYVETSNLDYLRVNILDKENNKLLQPEGYTYDQIKSIVVVYDGQEFVFKPDPKIFNLPKQLTEVKSIYSKYNFRKIPEWKLSILENDDRVTIKLSNVVDAIITKTKPRLEKRKKRKRIKNKKIRP
jgi:hypothetical protein